MCGLFVCWHSVCVFHHMEICINTVFLHSLVKGERQSGVVQWGKERQKPLVSIRFLGLCVSAAGPLSKPLLCLF